MKIKKGDKVQILAGKDEGKSGKILQVFTKDARVSVEGLNLLIKHLRPRRDGEKGQRIEFPASINSSNVMLVCPKCNKPTRVAYQYTEVSGDNKKAKKIRVCKKCKKTID